jgi:hypothetical protein
MTTEQPKPRKLLDRIRDKLRVKHYSIRTEKTYVRWIRRYILFHDKRRPFCESAAVEDTLCKKRLT